MSSRAHQFLLAGHFVPTWSLGHCVPGWEWHVADGDLCHPVPPIFPLSPPPAALVPGGRFGDIPMSPWGQQPTGTGAPAWEHRRGTGSGPQHDPSVPEETPQQQSHLPRPPLSTLILPYPYRGPHVAPHCPHYTQHSPVHIFPVGDGPHGTPPPGKTGRPRGPASPPTL